MLLRSWQCEKEELIVKVQVIFADAWEQHDSLEKLQSERLQQQKICKKLHDKVRMRFGWQQVYCATHNIRSLHGNKQNKRC